MTLREYINPFIPVINLVYKEKEENTRYKKTKLWFLYKHWFYGFEEFIDTSKLMYVSTAAKLEYKRLTNRNDLINQTWSEQPNWDADRSIFNFDHIFTGDMFVNMINDLWTSNRLSTDNIINLLKHNYRVAWILKTEERKLPRFKRGKTIEDAIKVYESKGIILEKGF